MIHQTRRVNVLLILTFASLERSQYTLQARNVHLAGQLKTKRAIASQQSGFANHQESFLKQAHVRPSALIARIQRANAMKGAGLGRV